MFLHPLMMPLVLRVMSMGSGGGVGVVVLEDRCDGASCVRRSSEKAWVSEEISLASSLLKRFFEFNILEIRSMAEAVFAISCSRARPSRRWSCRRRISRIS